LIWEHAPWLHSYPVGQPFASFLIALLWQEYSSIAELFTQKSIPFPPEEVTVPLFMTSDPLSVSLHHSWSADVHSPK
jgi:hypothetical protein